MKKILILSLLLMAGSVVFAQQNAKTKHMTITLVDEHVAFTIGKKTNNMFITRDDTAQVQKVVDLDPHTKARDEPAAFEQILMKLLTPYYNDNWKLVTSTAEYVSGTNTEIFRYYFTKE